MQKNIRNLDEVFFIKEGEQTCKNSEKQFAPCSTSLRIQLHSINLVLHKHHNFILCFVLNLKDQTYLADSRKNLLGN